jgi:hypothetical protein
MFRIRTKTATGATTTTTTTTTVTTAVTARSGKTRRSLRKLMTYVESKCETKSRLMTKISQGQLIFSYNYFFKPH